MLALITLNIWVLVFTKGYEISLGVFKISSHRAGRLFIAQVILALTLKIFFFQEIKESWKKTRILKAFKILPNRKIIGVTFLAIVLISGIAYYQTLSGYFLSDDFEYLNLFDRSDFLDSEILFNYLKKFGLIRPLSIVTLYVDYLIWGLNPVGFHLTNILIHIFNSFLIFLILFIILRKEYISMLSAFLFSLYPLHLESVAWISGRFDILCAFFCLLSIAFFLVSEKNNKRFSVYYLLSLVSFVFALFSKEMAIALPLVLILFDLFFTKKTKSSKIKDRLKIHYPYWVILLVYFIIRIIILGDFGGYSYPGGAIFLLQGNLYYDLKHLFLRPFAPLFIPLNKYLFADYIFLKSWVLFVLSIVILTFPFRKKLNFKLPLFGLLFIFLTVIPVFKILYISDALEGTRFLYLPCLGACLIIATFLKISYSKNEFVSRVINLIIPFAVLILFMLAFWRNSSSWIKAGEISKKISYQAMEKIQNIQTPRVIYTLNLPDNYQGAYVFRNGFQASLDLLGKPYYVEIIDIKKIKKSQLRKKWAYQILIWKEDKFHLSYVSYSYLLPYLRE